MNQTGRPRKPDRRGCLPVVTNPRADVRQNVIASCMLRSARHGRSIIAVARGRTHSERVKALAKTDHEGLKTMAKAQNQSSSAPKAWDVPPLLLSTYFNLTKWDEARGTIGIDDCYG